MGQNPTITLLGLRCTVLFKVKNNKQKKRYMIEDEYQMLWQLFYAAAILKHLLCD